MADYIDARLKKWATPRQAEYVDAVNLHGSGAAAARALGVDKGTVNEALRRLNQKARTEGLKPRGTPGFIERELTTHYTDDGTVTGSTLKEGPIPVCEPGGVDAGPERDGHDGYLIKGVSTYYDASGNQRGQWVKTTQDREALDQMRDAVIAGLGSEVRGLAPITPPPARTNSDILAVYPLGDPHFGMHAWGREAGEDFDLFEAERLTLAAIDRLVSTAPAAETAIILNLGDYFHTDDQSNQTPAHRHQLDVDSRFPKILEVGIRAMRHAIIRTLERHQKVIVRMEPGNHDPHATWALNMAMSAYFEDDPRVEIVMSPSKFWFYRFGQVLIGSTHGDTVKQEALLGVMATDAYVDWGLSRFRYWYTGHVHHQAVKELAGVTCESFRTLAAKDAYAASHGYRAGRDMRLIVHHKDYGEIERHRCDVAMLG